MTPKELGETGKRLFGNEWIGPLARAINYSHTAVWRASQPGATITRRMELEIEKLEMQTKKPKEKL